MGKTIKMVAMYGGREVVVGRCHPGQARKLRKLGLAEWDKDRLLMTQLASAPKVVESDWTSADAKFGVREAIPGWSPVDIKQKPIIRTDWERGILEDDFDEIDPEGLISMYEGNGKYARGEATVPTEIDCETLGQWAGELKTRREQEHSLYSCDDPMRRMIGFVDDNTNEVILMGLTVVKQSKEEDFEAAGIPREVFKALVGRQELLGVNPDGFSFAYLSVSPSTEGYEDELGAKPIPELEALWIQDAEEIRVEMEAKAKLSLAKMWAAEKPWTVEEVRTALGLKTPGQFMSDRETALANEPKETRKTMGSHRRTGSTTEMLLKVVAAALNGDKVIIRGHNPAYTTQLVGQAKDMFNRIARSSVLTPSISGITQQNQLQGNPPGTKVFADHYMGGR